jgi:hypothetical protein
MQLWKNLTPDEQDEYREFARTLYDPQQKLVINPVYHPVVRLELARLIALQAMKDTLDMGASVVQPLVDYLVAEGVDVTKFGLEPTNEGD